jgi:hypothetical protein
MPKVAKPWEDVLKRPMDPPGQVKSIFWKDTGTTLPGDYVTRRFNNASYSRPAKRLTLAMGRDFYNLTEWEPPYRFGPRKTGVAVPQEVHDLVTQKLQFEDAKKKTAMEAKLKLQNKAKEKKRFEEAAEQQRQKEAFEAEKWPEIRKILGNCDSEKVLAESFTWAKMVNGETAQHLIWGADESIPLTERCKRALLIFDQPRENKEHVEAKLAMKYEFPRVPDEVVEKVVARAWSGHHVGTVKTLTLGLRCQLALEAHVRYNNTDFVACKNSCYEDRRERYGRNRFWDDDDDEYDNGESPYDEAWRSVSDDIVVVLARYLFPLEVMMPDMVKKKTAYQTIKEYLKNPLWQPCIEKAKAIVERSMANS